MRFIVYVDNERWGDFDADVLPQVGHVLTVVRMRKTMPTSYSVRLRVAEVAWHPHLRTPGESAYREAQLVDQVFLVCEEEREEESPSP